MEKHTLLVMVISYIFGSIPFSLIVTASTIKGIDLKKIGSGNIGATNVARIGNKKVVALAFFLDSLKGSISVYITQQFFITNNNNLLYISAILAILGHMFPIWLKFKHGGKGIATTLGALIILNVYLALIFSSVWIITFFVCRISSLASLTSTLITLISSIFFQARLFITLSAIAMLIFIRHKKNIANLLQGKEYKFNKY